MSGVVLGLISVSVSVIIYYDILFFTSHVNSSHKLVLSVWFFTIYQRERVERKKGKVEFDQNNLEILCVFLEAAFVPTPWPGSDTLNVIKYKHFLTSGEKYWDKGRGFFWQVSKKGNKIHHSNTQAR